MGIEDGVREEDLQEEAPEPKKKPKIEQMSEDNDWVVDARKRMENMSDEGLQWLSEALKEEKERRKEK